MKEFKAAFGQLIISILLLLLVVFFVHMCFGCGESPKPPVITYTPLKESFEFKFVEANKLCDEGILTSVSDTELNMVIVRYKKRASDVYDLYFDDIPFAAYTLNSEVGGIEIDSNKITILKLGEEVLRKELKTMIVHKSLDNNSCTEIMATDKK